MAAARPESPKKIALLAVTDGGHRLAEKLAAKLPNAIVILSRKGFSEILPALWEQYDGLVFVMATGIVVRLIASLVEDKKIDPGVVVVDEKGRFAISLLSGHLGGGNDLAHQVAAISGGQPVITTASDVLGHTALDLWVREQGLFADEPAKFTTASAKLVNSGELRVFADCSDMPLPEDFVSVDDPAKADCVISEKQDGWPESVLLLSPRNLVVGLGCNRNTPESEIETAVREAFAEHGLNQAAIRNLASIDLKNDEQGLLAFAKSRKLRIDFFSKEQLNTVDNVSASDVVMRATGAKSVAEPAALLSAESNKILVRKMKWKNVTLAVAVASSMWSAPAPAA